MSITITIRNASNTVKHILTNDTKNTLKNIDDIQEYTNHGSELTVFLYDPATTDFHKYVFD